MTDSPDVYDALEPPEAFELFLAVATNRLGVPEEAPAPTATEPAGPRAPRPDPSQGAVQTQPPVNPMAVLANLVAGAERRNDGGWRDLTEYRYQ